jgi:hypothetical protein
LRKVTAIKKSFFPAFLPAYVLKLSIVGMFSLYDEKE